MAACVCARVMFDWVHDVQLQLAADHMLRQHCMPLLHDWQDVSTIQHKATASTVLKVVIPLT